MHITVQNDDSAKFLICKMGISTSQVVSRIERKHVKEIGTVSDI